MSEPASEALSNLLREDRRFPPSEEFTAQANVGADAYAAKLAEEARKFSLVHSELRTAIDRIVTLVTWALVPTGIAVLTFTTTANAIMQLGSAPEVRGRVMALYILVFLGGTPVGAPVIGALAEAFGPRSSIVAGGVITALSGVVAAAVMVRVRSLRLEAHLVRRRPHVHVHQLDLEPR